jgi:myo-inositol 2-dehydrogenase/D-chiro-inositol 1-dehydrogenase
MSEVVRYGIIGSGTMGREHISNLRLIPEARLVALADPHPASLTAAAALAGDEVATYENYRALLARDDIDVVVIATPNHTHAAVLEGVLATGRHILVEKPLCTTIEDGQAVVAAADAHKGLFWVAMEYRYMPPVARLIEEVRRGTVGRLRMLAIREHRFPFLAKVGDWNRFARNTGGTMVEKCCHFFDLMCLVVGERPVRVFGSGGQDVNHLDERYGGETPDILDNAFVIVDFAGGVRALLDLCMFAEASPDQEEISATGDAGKIACGVPSSELFIGRREPREERREHVPVAPEILAAGHHHGATYYQHLAFLKALRDGGPPEVSARDGLLAVAMGVAAERSIREGRPIDMAELGF